MHNINMPNIHQKMKLSISMTIYNDKEKHSPHDRDDLDYLWNKRYRNFI